ncbi:phosphatidylinositol mannoside acyltransferase [Pseudonocardia humida]|uniref:Phosphatidylinositol mannoside acyltransferase n=1 Tax=Pseudonocardia humida TaxID=2800819 RepID=A0ABT0ZRY4_9PSEU|nr:phosphatidylinositol mannoside acyltransferase [Pseudonocardia humida]MCO1653477.1 phosphatidylinositol mannoside acyltransferase [Pseudonocardia humida]
MSGAAVPGPRVDSWRERLTDAEYAAAWKLVGAVPAGLGRRAFERGADLIARRGGAGPGRLRANLARVVPEASPAELDRLVRDGLRSYARYWHEAFRLPATDPVAVHAATRAWNTGPFHRAIAAGRGVIFALPHSGNWDAAGVWLVEELRGLGHEPAFTTVAQRLRPESLYRRFVGYRESLGFEVVAAEDGAAAHRALTRRLRGGGVVCLLVERDFTASGVPVEFFGERARFPAGPARLAALTGALLLPAFPGFTPTGWTVEMAEPVAVPDRSAVPAALQAEADALAAMIRARPWDWHALQPVWSADRQAAPAERVAG